MKTLSDEELARPVPACPEWSNKDLFAHLVAIATDTVAGNFDGGVGTAEWTGRQIEERKDASVDDLVAEWEQAAAQLEPGMDEMHPAIAGGLIGDLMTHEQDARGGLDRPGGLDDAAFEFALESYVRFFGRRIKKNGLPALEVRAGDRSWTIGEGDPVGTLEGDPVELLRGLTGRRTPEQVRALDWGVDPEPYMGIFSNYGMPKEPLPE